MADLNGVIQIIPIIAIVYATSLLALSRVAPLPKPSRRQAAYGLHLEYPLHRESGIPAGQDDGKLMTDIVFVHGLGADPTLTWRQGDICWISDLLPEDLKQNGLQARVRILTFNYDSFWVRDANSTRLTITARSLGQQLCKKPQNDLVLVGHSYGGLVIKQALVDQPDLNCRVKGVMFLGTPHSGTSFSRYGIFAAAMLAPFDSDVDIMRLLVADNTILKDLNDKFQACYKNTKRRYYFETHKTRRYLLGFIPWIREFVVSEKSATDGGDSNANIALHTDHRGMNKFQERKGNYLLVVEELIAMICANEQAQSEVGSICETPDHENIQQTKTMDPQLQQQIYQNDTLPPQVLLHKPVILYDARGRIFPFSPDFIGSVEMFGEILAYHFKDLGLGKIHRGEWILQDHHTGNVLNLSKPWGSIFRPGQEIDMSMLFKKRRQQSSCCPRCQTENYGPPEKRIICRSCTLIYLLVEEVFSIDVRNGLTEEPCPLQASTTGKLPDKDSKLSEQFPSPRPFKVKDEDENMDAYTRVQVTEVDVHLQTDEPLKQADKSVALTLDQLKSTDSVAAYLAQIWGMSEEDCSILLANLDPLLRKAFYPEDDSPPSSSPELNRRPLDSPMVSEEDELLSSEFIEVSGSPTIPKSRLREALYPEDDSPPSSPPELNRRLLDSPMVIETTDDDESFLQSTFEDSWLDDFENSYTPDLSSPHIHQESVSEQQLRLQISQIIESIPAKITLTNGTSSINLNPPDLQLPRLRKKPSKEPVKRIIRRTSDTSARTSTTSITSSKQPIKQRTAGVSSRTAAPLINSSSFKQRDAWWRSVQDKGQGQSN